MSLLESALPTPSIGLDRHIGSDAAIRAGAAVKLVVKSYLNPSTIDVSIFGDAMGDVGIAASRAMEGAWGTVEAAWSALELGEE